MGKWVMGILISCFVAGCGYGLRGSQSALLEKENIRTIFVAPMENETFKPGVEQTTYNALVRVLASQLDARLVQTPDGADAVLQGRITDASFVSVATDKASKLIPLGTGDETRLVTTSYQARLSMEFRLARIEPPGKDAATVWNSAYSRQQYVPANTQLGVLGTTSMLINESEFDRALDALAERISRDVGESLVAFF